MTNVANRYKPLTRGYLLFKKSRGEEKKLLKKKDCQIYLVEIVMISYRNRKIHF